MPDEHAHWLQYGAPVPDEHAHWLQYQDRTYGLTPEHLAACLGLKGERVIRAEFKDGIWNVTTREKEPGKPPRGR